MQYFDMEKFFDNTLSKREKENLAKAGLLNLLALSVQSEVRDGRQKPN